MEIFWSPSDFQVTATAIANFRYLHEHDLIICRHHGYAPFEVLNDIYRSTTPTRAASESQSRDISTVCRVLSRKYSTTEASRIPYRGAGAPQKGICTCRSVLCLDNHRTGGCRGTLQEDIRVEVDTRDREHWIEVWVQSFSLTPGRQRWFIVSVGALDITGRNRPLDADHVTDLKNVFRRDGLERMAPENRLLCLCTATDIQFGDMAWSDEQSKNIRHWSEAISSPIEVLAGQHRIAALRDYVTETESDPAELWWTCELYDRG
ncbi:hypothetical protein E4U40_007617 [Claviceps sp. LM458 group G5]|nr:hypothetical protein E4U40_007617 [Claviceps sp. LM458 group G5]